MKIFLFIYILLTTCIGCTNKEKEMNLPITTNNKVKITKENFKKELAKYIRSYEKEPIYYIYVNHEQCFFEVLVNDIPAFRYFRDGGIMSPINLNEYIYHSGKQTITYRLYSQTFREDGPGFKTLTDYTKFEITGYLRDNADSINTFDNEVTILEHKNLIKENTNRFIGSGLPYYEYTIEFNAEVPFTDSTLDNVQDLNKYEYEILLQKTTSAYQYYRKTIENKDFDNFLNLNFNSCVKSLISLYDNQDYINSVYENYSEEFTSDNYTLEPLENYKMKIYANGKIVCLENKSTNLRLFNRSSIWGKFTTQDGITASFLKLYLYIPEGKDTFEIW